VRVSSVLPLTALGALAVAAGPLHAQGYRVDLDARVQGVSYRGWQLDSIPIGSVVTGSDGLLYTPDGIGVSCLAGRDYCIYYAPGEKVQALPSALTADFSVWNFGVQGLRFEGTGRVLTDFQTGVAVNQSSLDTLPAWPGTRPVAQVLEAYFAYDGSFYALQGGRLTNVSRFGYLGYDGAQVMVKEPKGRVDLTGRFGFALAEGALVPWTDASVNPLREFRPNEREKVWGLDLGWNLPWVQGRALYERVWFSNDGEGTTTSSELLGGDLSLRIIPSVTVSGGLDYDFAWGSIGNAEGAITASLPRGAGFVTLGGKRYRPRFPLWSIWSAFSPVPYNAFYGQATVEALRRFQVRGRLESYAYEETGTSTALVKVEDSGWRYGLGATYTHSASLHGTLDYQAGLGPGAQALTVDAGVFWRPITRVSLWGHVAYVERSLELRYSDAKLWQFGLDADATVYRNLRAFGGAWYLNEKRDRPDAAAFDWNQVRFHLGLRYGFGTTTDRPSLPPAILRIPEGGAQ
jgi:hypothetical protein